MDEKPEDVVAWLWRKADEAEGKDRARFREAARTIEVLRDVAGIRDELELADMEPKGNA